MRRLHRGGFGKTWRRRLVAFALAGGVAGALAGGTALALQITIKVDLTPVVDTLNQILDPVTYQIRTQVPTAGGCGAERIVKGIYGAPQPVDVGGSILPDVLVTVIPTPAVPPLTTTQTVTMKVSKLASGPLPVLVEAILAPSGSAQPGRVSVGYDACASSAPQDFQAQAVQQPSHLDVVVQTSGPGPNLTILGSTFSSIGGLRVNPTAVAARLAPVPDKVTATIDQLGDGHTKVHTTSSIVSTLALNYISKSATTSTNVDLKLDQLPQTTDTTFSANDVTYAVSSPIHDAVLSVNSAAVGSRSTQVNATIVDLPTTATFVKDGPKHATFTTPGVVGDALVRFASYEPATTLPVAPANPHQFMSAELRPTFDLIDLRVQDLKSAVIGWDDPMRVDVTHRAGPFDIRVATDQALITGAVNDLPAHVVITYAKATQTVTYSGSAPIGSLAIDLATTSPFMVRANQAHLRALDIPTGLTMSLDNTAKMFNAELTGGRLGKVELQLTSGPDLRLSSANDGLYFLDPAESEATAPPGTPYVLFARLSGVTKAAVGWGEPISAHLEHTASAFELSSTTFDMTVGAMLQDLPAVVDVSYSKLNTAFAYNGSAVMQVLTLDAHRTTPFVKSAHDLHLRAEGLPTVLNLAVDGVAQRLTTDMPAGALSLLEAQVTSGPDERLPAGVNGIKLIEKLQPETYVAFARLVGLSHVVVSWGDPMGVNITQTGGPIHISWAQQTAHGEFGEVLSDRTAEADIVDLPAQASFSYSPTTQNISYLGSASIGRVEADVHTSVIPIAGYTNALHLKVLDLPTQLNNLTIDMSHVNEKRLAVDVPSDQQIGLLELTLTDGTANNPLPDGTDGLRLYTRWDENKVEGLQYVFARATGLQHFRYDLIKEAGANSIGGDRNTTTVSSRLNAQHPIFVELVSPNDDKPDDTEFQAIDYQSPPQTINLVIEDNKNTAGDDFFRQITYAGSSVGGSVRFQTNAGEDRTLLDVTLAAVPQVVSACFSSDYPDCDDPFFNHPSREGEQSYRFVVSSTANLTVRDCKENKLENCQTGHLHASGYSGKLTDLSLDISRVFTLHVEDHEVTGTNNAFLHIDTGGEPLGGHIAKFSLFNVTLQGGTFPVANRDIRVAFPAEFRANHRYIELGCTIAPPDCFGDTVPGHPRGQADCPPGTHINKDTPVGQFEFADNFCPSAKPSSVTPAELAPGTTTFDVTVGGDDFSHGASISFWKPGATSPDGDIQVSDVVWMDFNTMRFTVHIDSDADSGPRLIRVSNPGGAGANFCDCFAVT